MTRFRFRFLAALLGVSPVYPSSFFLLPARLRGQTGYAQMASRVPPPE